MFMQRDFGTSLVFIAILGALFVISGVHWKILVTITGAAAALGSTLLILVFSEWGNKLLYWLHFKTYQLDRVRAWSIPFNIAIPSRINKYRVFMRLALADYLDEGKDKRQFMFLFGNRI
mgnify:CR=1 FL=1